MTSTPAKPTGPSNGNPVASAHAGTVRFMLTLCQLDAPISIRPPQSPQLKPYTFFMSRAYQPDGSERLYLHMGYFETLADAEAWVEPARRHCPNAFASIVPAALLRAVEPGAPSLSPGAAHSASSPALIGDESLTDTQVLRILGTRRGSTAQDDNDVESCDQIALLRPDDTGIRQALKEAVIQGAPVSFAVQLQWSAEPIDVRRVRLLTMFKEHTLYATESRRRGHSCHFLRLGFFTDPVSAKEVAVKVRSTFASAAVIPVVEAEVMRAREAAAGTSAIPYLAEQRVDEEVDSIATPESPRPSKPVSDAPRRRTAGTGTVDQTLEPRAETDMWTESDSLSDSGVRHLRVEVQDQMSGRWRIVRLGGTPAEEVQPNA